MPLTFNIYKPTMKQLKRERKKAKLTQTELARLSGVSQSFISRIESGSVNGAAFEVLDLLARALKRRGCDVVPGDLQPRPQPALIKGFRAERKGRGGVA
jgi:transcriptional regulator with XRE-family HTH domain